MARGAFEGLDMLLIAVARFEPRNRPRLDKYTQPCRRTLEGFEQVNRIARTVIRKT